MRGKLTQYLGRNLSSNFVTMQHSCSQQSPMSKCTSGQHPDVIFRYSLPYGCWEELSVPEQRKLPSRHPL